VFNWAAGFKEGLLAFTSPVVGDATGVLLHRNIAAHVAKRRHEGALSF